MEDGEEKGSGPGSPRSGDTGPGGTSGSSVWEGSENRKWELVVEEEQMIPSSNRCYLSPLALGSHTDKKKRCFNPYFV